MKPILCPHKEEGQETYFTYMKYVTPEMEPPPLMLQYLAGKNEVNGFTPNAVIRLTNDGKYKSWVPESNAFEYFENKGWDLTELKNWPYVPAWFSNDTRYWAIPVSLLPLLGEDVKTQVKNEDHSTNPNRFLVFQEKNKTMKFTTSRSVFDPTFWDSSQVEYQYPEPPYQPGVINGKPAWFAFRNQLPFWWQKWGSPVQLDDDIFSFHLKYQWVLNPKLDGNVGYFVWDTYKDALSNEEVYMPDAPKPKNSPITTNARKILDFATELAILDNGGVYIGTEHLLLALIENPGTVGKKFFGHYGMGTKYTAKLVIKGILEELSE